MRFQAVDHVMFGDTDVSGMGHFVHQLRFLERAEYLFMEHVGLSPRAWFLQRYLFPRVKLEVAYTAPLAFADAVRMDVQVGHLGRTSYSLAVDVVNLETARTAMTSRLWIAVLDPASRRPVPVPDALREAFAPYLANPSRDLE